MKDYVARELAQKSSSAEEFRTKLQALGGAFNSRPEECCVLARVEDEGNPIRALGGDIILYRDRQDRYCFNSDPKIRAIHRW